MFSGRRSTNSQVQGFTNFIKRWTSSGRTTRNSSNIHDGIWRKVLCFKKSYYNFLSYTWNLLCHTEKEKLHIVKSSQPTRILCLAFRHNPCLRQMAFPNQEQKADPNSIMSLCQRKLVPESTVWVVLRFTLGSHTKWKQAEDKLQAWEMPFAWDTSWWQ